MDLTIEQKLDYLTRFDKLPASVKRRVWESRSNCYQYYLDEPSLGGILDFVVGIADVVDMLELCESPIEQLLRLGMEEIGMCLTDGYVWNLEHQEEFELDGKKYRADFMIEYTPNMLDQNRIINKMIIECDGHNFHDRTKEQAKRDRERDRLFQKHGIAVLRFTGSEIVKDPVKCAEEFMAFIRATA